MATMLGSLLVSLGLDSGEFKSGLDAAEKEMRTTTRKFERMGKDLQRIGKSLTVGLSAPIAGVAVAFGRAAGNMAKESKSMANSARLAGEGFEDFQRQAYAARVGVGIEFEKLGDIFKDTQDKIGDFISTGGGEMADFFENIAPKVGLTKDAFVGLSGRDGLQLYYDALEKAGVSSDQMVFYMESIADEASGLIPLLKENGKLFKQLGADAKIISDADRKKLEEYTAAQLRMEAATRSLTIAFVNSGLLDSLVSIANSVADLAKRLAEASPHAFRMAAGALAVLAAIGPLVYGVGGLVKIMAPAIAAFKTFGPMVAAAAAASGSAIPIFAALRAALVSLTLSVAPYAAALAVVAGVIYLVTRRTDENTNAQGAYAKAQREAEVATSRAADAANDLANAHGEARKEALAQARAEAENIKQKRTSAFWSIVLARAELRRAQISTKTQRTSATGGVAGTAGFIQGQGDKKVAKARANVAAAQKTFDDLDASLKDLTKAINAPLPKVNNVAVPPADTGSSRSTRSASTRSGRSAAEIEAMFIEDQRRLEMEALSAKERLATNLEDRVDLQYEMLELERDQRLSEIAANEEYSDKQKDALRKQVELLYGVAAEVDEQGRIIANGNRGLIARQIEQERAWEIERQNEDMARVKFDSQRDLLQIDMDLADTQGERARIAADILALEQEYRRNQLKMVLASEVASDAEKKRAQAILDSLDAIEAGERAANARRNETDAQRYGRELNKTGAQISEEIDRIKISGLESLNDALVDAIVNFKSLKDVVHNVVKSVLADLLRLQIQQAIIKPLAQAMGIPIPGFATGTSFAPGGLALVGERGPELVNLPRGSKVKTAGVTKAMLGGGMGGNTIHLHMTPTGNPAYDRENASMAARKLRQTLNG